MKCSIVIFFVGCQINIVIVYSAAVIVLLLIAIYVVSRTAFILTIIGVLLLVSFIILEVTITFFRRPLIVHLIVLHIIKKLIIYKELMLYLIF